MKNMSTPPERLPHRDKNLLRCLPGLLVLRQLPVLRPCVSFHGFHEALLDPVHEHAVRQGLLFQQPPELHLVVVEVEGSSVRKADRGVCDEALNRDHGCYWRSLTRDHGVGDEGFTIDHRLSDEGFTRDHGVWDKAFLSMSIPTCTSIAVRGRSNENDGDSV